MLIATGAYSFAQAAGRTDEGPIATELHCGRLLLAAGVSIETLIVGSALGAYPVPLVLSVGVIAVVSVGLSLIGLELGAQLGARVENNSEPLADAALICVRAAIAAGLFFRCTPMSRSPSPVPAACTARGWPRHGPPAASSVGRSGCSGRLGPLSTHIASPRSGGARSPLGFHTLVDRSPERVWGAVQEHPVSTTDENES